ncbi:MAG: major facilitator superfamily 1 [Anaerocolumna sp.]|nr:major facilitator superfamily 1 [Anaerocolumna sp.]
MFHNLNIINKYLLAKIRKTYFMSLPENKEDLKSSRKYYTIADSAAQTIAQLAGGTFLATLMTFSNIPDAYIGIISSLVSLAALSQLFLINYMKRLKKYKLLVSFTSLVRILFTVIYFIPLLPINGTLKGFIIVLFYFIGQTFVQIGTPASQEWIASLVPSRLRGKYFAIKDSVAVFIISSTMLVAGVILDYFKERNISTGFIIIGLLILILVILNFISLSKMKEPKLSYLNEEGKEMHGSLAKRAKVKEKEEKEKSLSILKEIKFAFSNRKFKKVFFLQSIYITGFYISIPFNASYQINDLKLPYTFIMLVGFILNLYRIYITPKFGRLADRHGMAKMLRLSLFALGINLLVLAFTVPANAYVFHIIGSLLASTAWAFIGIGLFGIQLDYFSSDKRMIWITIVSSLSGCLGFFVSILGGSLLDYLQKYPITLFNNRIYAQQVLNMLGFLFMLMAVMYIKLFIEKEKVDKNHSDGRITM